MTPLRNLSERMLDALDAVSQHGVRLLAVATAVIALTIGLFLQSDKPAMPLPEGPLGLSAVQLTSSAGFAAPAPVASAFLPRTVATRPASPDAPGALPVQENCTVQLGAETVAGAMVSLTLMAPCEAGNRVTLHHQGMIVTERMPVNGPLTLTVPALAQTAVFIAEFPGGGGATARADVDTLPFYDRVALQWTGDAGLQLHALEFGAAYFEAGHVWSGNAGDLGVAARGEGGFLIRLGRDDLPEARMAEIYTFPSDTARRNGTIALSVEAEITQANCDTEVEAQTLQLRDGAGLRIHDLDLDLPGCDQIGDFLVLKNLLEDLTIAAR